MSPATDTTSALPKSRRGAQKAALLCYWVIACAAAATARLIWSPPSSGDMIGHASVVSDISSGSIWDWLGGGWAWSFGGGYPAADMYSPLIYLPSVAADWALGIDPYRVLLVLSLIAAIALPWAMSKCAHMHGTQAAFVYAMTAAGMFKALSFGDVIRGGSLYAAANGSIAQAVSLVAAFLFIGTLQSALSSRRPLWHSGLLLGLAVSSHYLGAALAAMAAVVMFAVCAVSSSDRRRTSARAGAVAAIGLAVSAHWWVPKIVHRQVLEGPSWDNDSSMWALLNGHLNTWQQGLPTFDWPFHWAVLAVGTAGLALMAFCDIRTRCNASQLGGMGLALSLPAAGFAMSYVALKQAEIGSIWEGRALGMWYLMCYIGASYVVTLSIAKISSKPARTAVGLTAAASVLIAFMFTAVQQSRFSADSSAPIDRFTMTQFDSDEISPRMRKIPCAARVAAASSDGKSPRIGLANTTRSGDSCAFLIRHPLLESSVSQKYAAAAGLSIASDPAAAVRMYADLGASKLFVSGEPLPPLSHASHVWSSPSGLLHEYDIHARPLIEPLEIVPETGSPDRGEWTAAALRLWVEEHFRQAADGGHITRLTQGGPAAQEQQGPFPNVEISQVSQGPKSVSFKADVTGVPVIVRVSYHPRWKAYGAAGPYRTAPGYMVVVPHGNEVLLQYEDDWVSHIPAISLAVLAATAFMTALRRRGAGLVSYRRQSQGR